jgi:hypothetical protein
MARRDDQGSDDDFGFPGRLQLWLADRNHAAALVALAQLREGIPDGEVIRSLLGAPATRTLKCSWELWEALLERRAEDAETLLLQQIPLEVLAMARQALWGDDPHPPSIARLRVIHL